MREGRTGCVSPRASALRSGRALVSVGLQFVFILLLKLPLKDTPSSMAQILQRVTPYEKKKKKEKEMSGERERNRERRRKRRTPGDRLRSHTEKKCLEREKQLYRHVPTAGRTPVDVANGTYIQSSGDTTTSTSVGRIRMQMCLHACREETYSEPVETV